MMSKKNKILCTCCAVCMSLQAQNASLTGRVKSLETKEPLQSVNVVIPNLELGSTTDISGKFIIDEIPSKKIELDIGNKIIDGSVATKLKKIKQSLLGI